MKKIVVFLLLVSSFIGFSQEDAWVYFKDKPNSATDLANPLMILSQRALDRRVAQGIPLNSQDAAIHQPYINEITSATGITVKAKSKWLNCVHVRGLVANINALKALPSVLKVDFADKNLNSLNAKTKATPKLTAVNKTMQTAVTFNYGGSFNQIQMLNGHLLHQMNFTGSGKIIAVLDSGFPGVDSAFPFKRLRDNNQILGGYDFINKSTNYFSGNNHGTLVLSSMGGFVDGQLVGTATDAKYYLYVTEDAISAIPYNENPVEESNWVEAAEEADRVGVDIISTSLGYFGYNNANYSHTYADMTGDFAFASKGANIAFEKGIIVVASAGNEGEETEPHVGIPAEAKNVIAVGAVKSDESLALFSSIGPSFDGRVKPDVMAQGQTVVVSNENGGLGTANGTSFSCPITSGMLACLWQALPGKNAKQIKQLVTQSSDNFSEPAGKSRIQFGYGIPDFDMALSTGLSVVDVSNDIDFMMYPNPTSEVVSVSTSNGSDLKTIVFYNILGQQVLKNSFATETATISLKSLNNGIYFYKIEWKDFSRSGKVIKK